MWCINTIIYHRYCNWDVYRDREISPLHSATVSFDTTTSGNQRNSNKETRHQQHGAQQLQEPVYTITQCKIQCFGIFHPSVEKRCIAKLFVLESESKGSGRMKCWLDLNFMFKKEGHAKSLECTKISTVCPYIRLSDLFHWCSGWTTLSDFTCASKPSRAYSGKGLMMESWLHAAMWFCSFVKQLLHGLNTWRNRLPSSVSETN